MTRRQWLLELGGGAALIGWTGVDLEAADLPPGVYEPSREHLGHALAGHPIAAGGETEFASPPTANFRPVFFSGAEYRDLAALVGLMLGEAADASIVQEIAQWIDLTVSEEAGLRTAARALSPAHREVAVHYHGTEAPLRKLEESETQQIAREGLAWLGRQSHQLHGASFASLSPLDQASLIKSVSDLRPDLHSENSGTRLFAFVKERTIHGFYTSRAGLNELGYRGNAFYASPPGCEHLYA